MTNPTEALDAVEQALQGLSALESEEHNPSGLKIAIQLNAMSHIATLRQQVKGLQDECDRLNEFISENSHSPEMECRISVDEGGLAPPGYNLEQGA